MQQNTNVSAIDLDYIFSSDNLNTIYANKQQQLTHKPRCVTDEEAGKKLPHMRHRVKENSRLLPKRATDIMMDWYERNYANPYPTYRDYEQMAKLGSITVNQVKQWFVNVRRRTQNQFRKRRVPKSEQVESPDVTSYAQCETSLADESSPSPPPTVCQPQPQQHQYEQYANEQQQSTSSPLTSSYDYRYYYNYASYYNNQSSATNASPIGSYQRSLYGYSTSYANQMYYGNNTANNSSVLSSNSSYCSSPSVASSSSFYSNYESGANSTSSTASPYQYY